MMNEMDKEKQIEEMRKTICDGCGIEHAHCGFISKGKWCPTLITDTERLYKAGYRKQIEGRWMRNEDHNAYESEYFCSECLADGNNQGNEPFCWNCGAKMKGGE
jgi:hypothetical protein